ncbi:MAG: ankyrin repeat domain-containing protein [Phycisphaerae bacterium]|nr:ankyrin repeat domain-containing protein [Phycisphaerae bacterium]
MNKTHSWTFIASTTALVAAFISPLALFAADDPKPQTPPAPTAPVPPARPATPATPRVKPADPGIRSAPAGQQGTQPAGAATGKGTRPDSPSLTANPRVRDRTAPVATPDGAATLGDAQVPVRGAPIAGPNPQVAPAAAPVLRFDPEVLDFGDMLAGVSMTKTVRVFNISDAPVTITRAVPGCGCTIATWPKDPIAPGASGDAEISLKPPEKQGVDLHKKVTFQLDGHPPVSYDLKGHVAEIIRVAPDFIDAPAPDASAEQAGEIAITSLDKTPFKIVGVNPPIVKDAGTDSSLEHKVHIDWAAWAEQGKPAKLSFTTDHPKAPSLMVIVKRSVKDSQPIPPRPAVDRATSVDPLIHAVRQKDAKAVEMILAGGADANKKDDVGGGRTALHWAVKEGQKEIIEVLLKNKANLEATDRVGKTALSMAAENKDGASMVAFLLEKGANVNPRDQIGGSPLLWAAGLGATESVKLLVAKGADVNVVDVNGLTPLLWAAGIGSPETVETLLKAGAKTEVADKISGDTALMRAARTGRGESVILLVKAGAPINARNNSGQSAFMLAATSGTPEKLKALKDGGADIKATCVRGWNAMDYAKNRIDQERGSVVTFLEPLVQAAATTSAPATQPAGGTTPPASATTTGGEKPAETKPVATKQ